MRLPLGDPETLQPVSRVQLEPENFSDGKQLVPSKHRLKMDGSFWKTNNVFFILKYKYWIYWDLILNYLQKCWNTDKLEEYSIDFDSWETYLQRIHPNK